MTPPPPRSAASPSTPRRESPSDSAPCDAIVCSASFEASTPSEGFRLLGHLELDMRLDAEDAERDGDHRTDLHGLRFDY